MSSEYKPTMLLILDGWGIAPDGPGNAVSLANTPNLDRILAEYPRTAVNTCGRDVGLPDGFMGNSEVGHMNIGAGRIVYQDMTRIDLAIENDELKDNQTLNDLFASAKDGSGRIHFMGLLSDGGVHSHNRHLYALLRLAHEAGLTPYVHCFMDGRDTAPDSGQGFMGELLDEMDKLGAGQVATVSGRYWSMDRDKRWDRTRKGYDALTQGQGELVADTGDGRTARAAVLQAYEAGETDEFIKPRVILTPEGRPVATIEDGDALFFFNFRADRARQMTQALFDDGFDGFERAVRPAYSGFATMTRYEQSYGLPVAFPPVTHTKVMGEVVSGMGLRQLRIAETEKYAHVTYFFNCGREEPFPNEERRLIQSPRDVPTYDYKPEMSVYQVTETLLDEWQNGGYSLVVCNFANCDMVGHTGVIPAAVRAVEAVDTCLGKVAEAVLGSGGRILLTADHGNAEEMLTGEGRPQTAHSLNQVNLVVIDDELKDTLRLKPGVISDIVPTILKLWGVTPPEEMTRPGLLDNDA